MERSLRGSSASFCFLCLGDDTSSYCCESDDRTPYMKERFYVLVNAIFFTLLIYIFWSDSYCKYIERKMRSDGVSIHAEVIGKTSTLVSRSNRGDETYIYEVEIKFTNISGMEIIRKAAERGIGKDEWNALDIGEYLNIHHLPEYPNSALLNIPDKSSWFELVCAILGIVALLAMIFGYTVVDTYADLGLGSLRMIRLILCVLPVTMILCGCFIKKQGKDYENVLLGSKSVSLGRDSTSNTSGNSESLNVLREDTNFQSIAGTSLL
mmetsp:Transcript_25423/g.45968  ORF Transcript_25423/g.45968 Transcript_25423/m.45968 type:complete len:266 (+) Transcript_25423:73-870(+)|eukprot:CAMPEP_0201647312 /NCGR_PEP_ID=MMETSP0493-20130528/35539_1 /ASSEMBLY_ACC=CAM_ASM_000838 /TAXON_ID=420259 /ORGANISM="Thalassiosira gravida, Strain GMp14c1" /LENGTH=265 /DNA_ID=CAMNT_0048122681 /DNA_START=62 /DNA_END=859 /DNA_ORIENTATION=+